MLDCGCMNCAGLAGLGIASVSCDGAGGTDIDGNVLNSDGSLYTGPCPASTQWPATAHCDGAGGTNADGNTLNSDGSLYTGPCPIMGPIAPGSASGGMGIVIPLVLLALVVFSGRRR
jgi:uncharacterized protein (TIGR03382 family)